MATSRVDRTADPDTTMPASDVFMPEDRALELATRPQRGVPLTAEERKVRRRLQYKLHQRRHRAKQHATTTQLQDNVAQLRDHVEALMQRHHALLHVQQHTSNVFDARGTDTGAPMRAAMEYLRLFEHGYVDEVVQAPFLRSVMAPDVIGPDYQGVEYMLDQWRLYRAFFPQMQFLFKGFEVVAAGDATIVVLDVVLSVRSRRDGVLALYPGMRHDEHVIQTMVGAALEVPGKMRFSFDADGVCTWFGTEFDFVAGLQRALGSLETVAKCLQSANISFATGQIQIHLESQDNQVHADSCPPGVQCMYTQTETDTFPTERAPRWAGTPSWTCEL